MFFKLLLENSNSDRIDMMTMAKQYMTLRGEGLNPPTGTIILTFTFLEKLNCN